MTRRNDRQRRSYPEERIGETPVLIVGVGSVGHRVAQFAAPVGFPLTLVDPDRIEEVNIGPQGWLPQAIGNAKADEAFNELLDWLPEGSLALCEKVENAEMSTWNKRTVVVCCVDSMDCRRWMAEKLPWGPGNWLLDGRIGPNLVRNYACQPACVADREWFLSTLSTEAESEPPECADRMTVWQATLCASLHMRNLSRILQTGVGVPRLTEYSDGDSSMWAEDRDGHTL